MEYPAVGTSQSSYNQLTTRQFLRVLVVEDDEHLRDLICDAIRHLGIPHVHDASEGTEALSLTASIRPDIVFSDVQMEPMGGIEYLKKLRTMLDSKLAGTPVVFLTATSDQETVLASRQLTVNGFIVKPPRGSQIKAAINRIFPGMIP